MLVSVGLLDGMLCESLTGNERFEPKAGSETTSSGWLPFGLQDEACVESLVSNELSTMAVKVSGIMFLEPTRRECEFCPLGVKYVAPGLADSESRTTIS